MVGIGVVDKKSIDPTAGTTPAANTKPEASPVDNVPATEPSTAPHETYQPEFKAVTSPGAASKGRAVASESSSSSTNNFTDQGSASRSTDAGLMSRLRYFSDSLGKKAQVAVAGTMIAGLANFDGFLNAISRVLPSTSSTTNAEQRRPPTSDNTPSQEQVTLQQQRWTQQVQAFENNLKINAAADPSGQEERLLKVYQRIGKLEQDIDPDHQSFGRDTRNPVERAQDRLAEARQLIEQYES